MKSKAQTKGRSPSPQKNDSKKGVANTKGNQSNSKGKNQKNAKVEQQKTEPKEEPPKTIKVDNNGENSRISPEKRAKLLEDRKKRIKKEKETEKKDRELYDKIISEAKNNNSKSQTFKQKMDIIAQPTNIKISEKKARNILEQGGMLDAYKYLITNLCKNGLPTGNLFDYASYIIHSYEKKWKEKKSKEMKEKLEKYWADKEKDMKMRTISVDKLGKKGVSNEVLNRSLEERKMKSFIQSLDRSRSSHRVKEPISISKRENSFENSIIKEDKEKKGKDNKKEDKKRKQSPKALPRIKDAKQEKQRQLSNKKNPLIRNKK